KTEGRCRLPRWRVNHNRPPPYKARASQPKPRLASSSDSSCGVGPIYCWAGKERTMTPAPNPKPKESNPPYLDRGDRPIILVSRVNNATDTQTTDSTALEVIQQIRSGDGMLRELILRIRTEYWRVMAETNNDRRAAKNAVAKLKKSLA